MLEQSAKATVVGDETLAREAWRLAARMNPSADERTLEAVARFSAEPACHLDDETGTAGTCARLEALPGLDRKAALALLLAKAVAPSPALVPEPLAALVATALSPEAQVELVVWIAVQQMLHRLGCFLDA